MMAPDQVKFHLNSSKRKKIDGPFSQNVFHGKFGQCDLSLLSSIMSMVRSKELQYVTGEVVHLNRFLYFYPSVTKRQEDFSVLPQ